MNVAAPHPQNQGQSAPNPVQDAEIWMVRNEGNVVGPVSLVLIERGVAAGKIPSTAELAHADDQFHADAWQPVSQRFPLLVVEPQADRAEPIEVAPEPQRRILPPPASARPRRALPTPSSVRPAAPTAPAAQSATPSYPHVPPPPAPGLAQGAPTSPVPPPPPSYRYPEEPVSIPKHGLLGSVFGITFG